jgi:hypothetical protein
MDESDIIGELARLRLGVFSESSPLRLDLGNLWALRSQLSTAPRINIGPFETPRAVEEHQSLSTGSGIWVKSQHGLLWPCPRRAGSRAQI